MSQHLAGPWVELSGSRRFPQGFKKYLMVRSSCNNVALAVPGSCMPGVLHVCALCMIPALLKVTLHVRLCRACSRPDLLQLSAGHVSARTLLIVPSSSSGFSSVMIAAAHKLHADTCMHSVNLRVQAMPASVGLLMPAVLLLASIFLGDDRLLLATCTAPYLLTLLTQIWMEGHFVKQGACQVTPCLPLARQTLASPDFSATKHAKIPAYILPPERSLHS